MPQNVSVNGGERKTEKKKRSIAERLIEARGSRTQQEVAQAVGIGRSALGMYENGQRVPRDEVKVRLADYYGKTVQELFY